MISYEEAKKRASLKCSGCDLIESKEDEKYFRFCFGIKGELPLPGMPEILVDKYSGKVIEFNYFTELQKEHKNDEIKPC